MPQVQGRHVMEIHLKTGTPTKTLACRVEIVAHDDGHKGGIIGNPVQQGVQ